ATKLVSRWFHPEKVNDSQLLNIVKEGARRGLTECDKLFNNETWNCPSDMYEKLTIFVENTTTRLDAATRETAFIHAISAAAITHEITLHCTQEKIPGCGCSKKKHRDGHWIIKACVDDIEFGMSEARRFLDKLENGGDARTAVNLHNNAVGREVVLSSQQKECLCRDATGLNLPLMRNHVI
ncbi:Ligand for members of the frizzled of seven transmembrane receptor, partial [Desmophyllum pertusum]